MFDVILKFQVGAGLGQGIRMTRRVLLGSGAVLTLGCLSLLFVGYAPEAFRSHEAKLDVVAVAPKCDGPVALDLTLRFREPRFWAGRTATPLTIPEVNRCKSYWLSATNSATVVRLRSTEAVFAGEKRETERILVPKPSTGPSLVYEFNTAGLSKHWSLVVDDAFVAKRTGFDRYAADGVLSLTPGDWTLRAGADPAYAIGGTSEWSMKVVSEARPEDRDLIFGTSVAFARITEHKDVFGILISTVLGLALATLVQGLAMVDHEKKRSR
jgi:hypothetical protein